MGESILAQTPADTSRSMTACSTSAPAASLTWIPIGIDMHVLSLTSPGVQVFDGPLATRLAAASNDALAAAVQAHPTRFAGLAAIAPQDPTAAALEIERAAGKLGLCGVIINSHTNGRVSRRPQVPADLRGGRGIRHADLPPSARARAVDGDALPRLRPLFCGWGFAAETGLHAMRLIMSGTFDRFPKLRIVLGHMGEGIPFWLQRIDNRYLLEVKIGAVDKLPKLPSEYFLDNFVITTAGVTSMPALRLCLDVLGVDRILFAADFLMKMTPRPCASWMARP